MKKLLILATFLFISAMTSFAQSAEANYDLAAARLVELYNHAYYDSIWQLFSKSMQTALPLEKTIEFFSGVRKMCGNIDLYAYSHKSGRTATYKLTFEEGIRGLNFILDKDDKIAGLTIKQFEPGNLPVLVRNSTRLILPFNGAWNIAWGGDTRAQNHHIDVAAQKGAFDIVIMNDEGKTYRTNGKTNEDYYAFGQPLLAPCDAEVVQAVDGIKDNIPGEKNPMFVPGNSVMLKTPNNEFILLAHFKNHSVKVKEGEQVKQGQVLGYCGNSGNSTGPHLHFHIENVEDMNIATGAKCYFENIVVNGSGQKDYSPVKGDKVENIR